MGKINWKSCNVKEPTIEEMVEELNKLPLEQRKFLSEQALNRLSDLFYCKENDISYLNFTNIDVIRTSYRLYKGVF